MKSVIKYGCLMLMFTATLLISLDISYTARVKTELNDTAEISMRDVLKGKSINKVYEMDEKDMEAELIRNVAMNANIENDLLIGIYEIDEHGFIDMSLTSSYKHLNGVDDEKMLRKGMLVEQFTDD